MRPAGWLRAVALGLVAGAAGCNDVWGIAPRELDPHLICSEAECGCAAGFDDCDGDPGNGCEADLTQVESCGGCGRVCDHGSCEGGACACSAAFADCDGDPGNGCEAAIESDAASCGRCDHGCLGGACESGRCQPIVLAESEFPDDFRSGPVLHAGYAYVGRCIAPSMGRIPLTGGTFQPVAMESGCAYHLVTDGGQLYWSNSSKILVQPLDQPSAPTVVFSNLAFVGSTSIGGGWFYWNELVGSASVLSRGALSPGAAPEQIWPNGHVLGTRADGERVYVGTSDGVRALVHGESTVLELAPGRAEHLALDTAHLYWVNTPTAEIRRLPLAGGESQLFVTAVLPGPLALDAAFLYWTDRGTAAIHRAPLDGQGESAVVAGDVAKDVIALAVDAEAVYWLTPQQLLKVAK